MAGIVHGRWEVVAGSATGALKGLRGHGVFTAEPAPPGTEGQNRYPTATDCFTYWYEN